MHPARPPPTCGSARTSRAATVRCQSQGCHSKERFRGRGIDRRSRRVTACQDSPEPIPARFVSSIGSAITVGMQQHLCPQSLVVSIISNRALNDWRSQVRYISGNLKLLEIHIIWDPPPLLRDRRIILPFFSLRYFTGSVARVASRESFCILYREPRKCRAIERDQPTISLLCLAGLVA